MHYSRRNFLNKLAGAVTFLGMPLYGLKDSIAEPSKLNIGIIASITGPMAGLGQEALRAAQMAVREINSQGGIRGIKTHLYIMDDAGRIDMAYQAFNSLAHRKNPVALIGASYIRYDKILSDLAERYKIPFFVINPFRKTWHRKELKYTFRIVPEVSLMAKQALSYLKKIADEKGAPIKRIGIFRTKSSAWEEAMEKINVSSKREKLSVTFDFTVPHNINGIRSIVHKSKNIPADIIILLMGGGFHMKTIVETMREIRYRTKAIVGFFSKLADTTYVAEHGNLFINLMDANYWADTKRREIKIFEKRFLEQFGVYPSNSSYGTYTSIMILRYAMEKSHSVEKNRFTSYMHKAKFPSFLLAQENGIQFDRQGRNINAETILLQVSNPRPIPIYPVRYAKKDPVYPISTAG